MSGSYFNTSPKSDSLNIGNNSSLKLPKRNKSNECCWVFGCKSSRRNSVGVKYHQFPKDEDTVLLTNQFGQTEMCNKKKIWEDRLLVGKRATKSMKVCSLHFTEDDYTCSGAFLHKKEGVLKGALGWSTKKILKLSALPSQNLPHSQTVKTEAADEDNFSSPIKKELHDNAAESTTNMNASLPNVCIKEEAIEIKEEITEDQVNNEERKSEFVVSKKRRKGQKFVSVDALECPKCEFLTISKLFFLRHLKYEHDLNVDAENLSLYTNFVQKYIECNYCPFKAKSRKYLKIHETKHFSNSKPFLCANCNYKTNRKHNLIDHVKRHGSVQFKCVKCDFITSNLGFFTKHMKNKHPEVCQFYKCEKCGFKSREKQNLDRHLNNQFECESLQVQNCINRTVNCKIYKCSLCDFRSESVKTLMAHSVIEHDLNHQSGAFKEMFSVSKIFSD